MYYLLPFRFQQFEDKELLVNEVGDYLFCPQGTVSRIVHREIDSSEEIYQEDHVHINYQGYHVLDSCIISEILNDFEKTAYLDEHYLETYDTGGYTGDWGADGKLAMLHEKELVLNKSDTENVLTIVDIVRNLIKDLGKLTIFGGTLRSVGTQGLEQQTLEQKVEIKAEFPNVQDHNEIEQAFENLVNQAAQFANLK